MKCYYHKSDLDGHCSGNLVKYKNPGCEMIGVDYNDNVDFEDITKGEKVYIVDFSFSRDVMKKLNSIADLHWIDHHKSAIEKCAGLNIKGLREIGLAGCELVWNYMYHPNGPMPEVVRLLGRYDVWDHEDKDVLPFQYGVRSCKNTLPGANIWDDIFSDVPKYLKIGRVLLDYENTQNEKIAKGMYYEKDFEGYRAIVINKPYSNSKVFDSVYDSEKHDIMVRFGMKNGEYKYSLYCDKDEIDVSKIAIKFGGGGHKGAAGFYTKEAIL